MIALFKTKKSLMEKTFSKKNSLATSFYSSDFEFDETTVKQSISTFVETPLTAAAADAAADASARSWHRFYGMHGGQFFHSRSYLYEAFPQLKPHITENVSSFGTAIVLELGCGNGSNIWPLTTQFSKEVNIFASDVTPNALRAIISNPIFEKEKERIRLFLFDISKNSLPIDPPGMILTESPRSEQIMELNRSFQVLPNEIVTGQVDAILCTFVLSALHPRDHSSSFINSSSILKKNGMLFFRDYGIGDAAFLRMGPEARLQERLFKRGDGTLAYFFTKHEIQLHLENAGFHILQLDYHTVKNHNRKTGITMMRVFLNGVAIKL
jgi:SAM-dependent methyltransferase